MLMSFAGPLLVCGCAPPQAFGGGDLVKRPASTRRYIQRIGEAEREAFAPGPRDHRTVVGAQFRWRQNESGADLKGESIEHLSHRPVRDNASRCNERGGHSKTRAEKHQPGTQPIKYHIDDGLLKSRTKVGHVLVAKRCNLFRFQPQRGLQTRERKIGIFPSVHRTRQPEAHRVAARGFLLDLRPAWIAESGKFYG